MLSSTSRPRASRISSPSIPVALAYSAAILLALASATTNVASAVAKHDTASGAFVAGCIALSVALLVLIALPASLSAFRAKQYVASAIAGLVFALAASYSTTSAIGILAKPRIEAAYKATDDKAARDNLRADRKRAMDELATLAPARSSAELSSLIAGKQATPGANGCNTVNGPISMRVCGEVEQLKAESARFDRIAALSAVIERADKGLSAIGSQKVENADAAALTAVAGVLGFSLNVEAVNVMLMLLAVTILECGSGLSLAIAQSMRVAAPAMLIMRDITPASNSASLSSVANVPAVIAPASVPATVAPTASVQDVADNVVRLVRDAGGELHVASKYALAKLAGTSGRTLARALAVGAVVVAADNGGLVVRLAA